MASSILNSNTTTTVVLATAMAVSGTVIVLALRLQKFSLNHLPRSCISSEDKKRGKKKKKVQFAEDVVEPSGNGEEFRKRHANQHNYKKNTSSSRSSDYKVAREMAANRMALYNGILRDRVVNRTAYSY
ncbi:Outward-rectifying potassium channel 4-like protein [Heracleum sosnowskyi]|uniref:Outward-rectifying potassium channel 4-like protein n=1 Tax=Heracleum sosnowskyi TaxID=360622 RepID=A0AAD8JFS8_9APIA|nr:Outward-rectifying potassium channel 4-like protein [Heracleum sosnowskyi]